MIPEVLTAKLGPLPRWGWVLVAVGGFVALRVLQARQSLTAGAGNQAGGSPATDLTPFGPNMYGGELGGGSFAVSSIPTSAMAQTASSSGSAANAPVNAPQTSGGIAGAGYQPACPTCIGAFPHSRVLVS